jgi:hypothetical protein
MPRYKGTYERVERYVEHFEVKADSREEAEEMFEEMNEDHDWTENEVQEGSESLIAIQVID